MQNIDNGAQAINSQGIELGEKVNEAAALQFSLYF